MALQSANIDIASAIAVNANHGSAGQYTVDRTLLAGQILTPSELHLTSWLAPRTENVNTISTWCTVASATITLQRQGIYTVNDDGSITLVAAFANDVAMWQSAAVQTKTLSATLQLQAGQRYALGNLFVGTTAPTLACQGQATGTIAAALEQAVYFSTPWKVARVATQTDLVAIGAGHLSAAVVVSTAAAGAVAARLSLV